MGKRIRNKKSFVYVVRHKTYKGVVFFQLHISRIKRNQPVFLGYVKVKQNESLNHDHFQFAVKEFLIKKEHIKKDQTIDINFTLQSI